MWIPNVDVTLCTAANIDDLSKALDIFRSIPVNVMLSTIAVISERVFAASSAPIRSSDFISWYNGEKFLCPVLLKLSIDEEISLRKRSWNLSSVTQRGNSRVSSLSDSLFGTRRSIQLTHHIPHSSQ
jgi:hypothetical protein